MEDDSLKLKVYKLQYIKIYGLHPRNYEEVFLGLYEHYKDEAVKILASEEQMKRFKK